MCKVNVTHILQNNFRNELACPVMGNIFLVYVGMDVSMSVCRFVGLSTKNMYAKMRGLN